ncbi:MAG: pyrimidine 5'-nucleotidase [Rhodobacteraceae bacterium]|nr:pyrimidine 5'-nucleotidase [Paracoccaceae bacterium]
MVRDAFSHVRTWVFDLDNTLYPPSSRLFDQIEVRMTAWVSRALGVDHLEASRIRADYWRRFGTTLAGLIELHGIDPLPYMEDVHDISLFGLTPDPDLAERIAALPGRRIVYTNGPRSHAARVLERRGLSDVFEGVFGAEDAGFVPKPRAGAFHSVFSAAGVEPERGAMFEDDPRNLEVPHGLGMRTVLVHATDPGMPHVEHQTDDLGGFLGPLAGQRQG